MDHLCVCVAVVCRSIVVISTQGQGRANVSLPTQPHRPISSLHCELNFIASEVLFRLENHAQHFLDSVHPSDNISLNVKQRTIWHGKHDDHDHDDDDG